MHTAAQQVGGDTSVATIHQNARRRPQKMLESIGLFRRQKKLGCGIVANHIVYAYTIVPDRIQLYANAFYCPPDYDLVAAIIQGAVASICSADGTDLPSEHLPLVSDFNFRNCGNAIPARYPPYQRHRFAPGRGCALFGGANVLRSSETNSLLGFERPLTHEEAADYLGVCGDQLDGLVDDEEISRVNIARKGKRPRWRYERDELDAFKERRKQRGRSCRLSTGTRSRSTFRRTSGSVDKNIVDLQEVRIAERRKRLLDGLKRS